jgi:hypothetical protein
MLKEPSHAYSDELSAAAHTVVHNNIDLSVLPLCCRPRTAIITIDSFTLEGAGWSLPLLKLTESSMADITIRDAPR